ncbi:MAG TPA: TonB family protein [Thermoanaerobaculia bacterium]|nr:TonB family protein [Thermoanaerobaculia bacterium]
MRDRVADVLAQRAALESGAGKAIALSLLLHGGLTALAIYAALHAPAPKALSMVSIHFASFPRTAAPAPTPRVATPAPAPVIDQPKPVVPKPETPKIAAPTPLPVTATTPAKPEKNTVPLSPFGRSTRKGSESPAPPPVAATPPATATGAPGLTTTDVPIGGAGVTGLEGGDFPYTIYIEAMQRKVGTNWVRGQVTPGTTTLVYFRIQRDGRITDSRVETPSGNGRFDRAALSAVMSASPLNPLPFGYTGPYLGVHLTFR